MKDKPAARQLVLRIFQERNIEEVLREELGKPVEITFTDNRSTMISQGKGTGGAESVRLHYMFKDADEATLKALAGFISRKDRASSEALGKFINKNARLIRKKGPPRKIKINSVGKYFDLGECYRRLNDRYFDGQLKARITWGKAMRRRGKRHIRLGSYSYEDRVIYIHPALDKRWTPLYYVESVIHHEMLHARFGYEVKNGRARYHTRQFRQAEKRFAQYRRAVEWEKKNIQRLMRARG